MDLKSKLIDYFFGKLLQPQSIKYERPAPGKPLTRVDSYQTPKKQATPSPTVTPTALPTVTPTPSISTKDFSGYNQVQPQGDIRNLVLSAANQYNVHPALLASLLWSESGYNPNALNNGDYGIAQINLASHPNVTMQQAYDPSFAIPWAAKHLSTLINDLGINRGIAAYNVGAGGASINGPKRFGGGPKGQIYINKISHNLSPELIQTLGLLPDY